MGLTSRNSAPPTPKPEASPVSFLKRDILALKEETKTLMTMYEERIAFEDSYHEALHDNDPDKAERFRFGIKECNGVMHAIYESAIASTTTVQSSMPEEEDFHLASSGNDQNNEFLPSRSFENDIRRKSQSTKAQCSSTKRPFSIWLVYSDHETALIVWDTMPLEQIFQYAIEWMEQACNIDIGRESMFLVLRPDCQLNANGYVFSVPIVEDDVIDIQIELAQTQTRTPRGQRAIGRQHRNDLQQPPVVRDHPVLSTR